MYVPMVGVALRRASRARMLFTTSGLVKTLIRDFVSVSIGRS